MIMQKKSQTPPKNPTTLNSVIFSVFQEEVFTFLLSMYLSFPLAQKSIVRYYSKYFYVLYR